MSTPLQWRTPASGAEAPASPGLGHLRTFAIWTIGCQMNKADSERLASALLQLGLEEAPDLRQADVIVLNSCVVRQSAEDKVVGTLGLVKPLKERFPHRIIALMGCMVGPKTDALRQRFPYVDVFARPQEYKPILDLVSQRLGIAWEGCLTSFVPPRPTVSAYIPVIHGCDRMCTFCIIPYRRGREVSRPLEEVVREVHLLAQRGVREVVLLGQIVDRYGHDLPGKPDLADLLEAVHAVPGIARIRFLTSHPADMTDRIIQAVARLEKVCKHINIPVQAGDDEVLARMHRGYTRDDYLRLIERIRSAVPAVALSTDVIVGFCGETEAQFQRTLDLLAQVQFDKVHIAPYSERPGTIASRKMADDVPPEEKRRRVQEVERLQERIAASLNARYLGKTVEVLVDGQERGKWRGRTDTDKLVFFADGQRDYLGKLVDVRITKTSPWALQGEPVGAGR
ncbi:MAG: tRNA (N6-isopentenyl adenosine(37)-C2)-methylthiotransferase MiaB [Dehalococcoidia bacterium]|nr:tRNA (N6-isopentenyl adenosine(37)-C2)-methylthiotransferase MiaB [Dehalococcoidia bacterium]MDW8119551.1 tRNA (N6-isopentenyl adenosine(37)-C2)-methylthiotransferase MiaB [Chloroflexota bacterium]